MRAAALLFLTMAMTATLAGCVTDDPDVGAGDPGEFAPAGLDLTPPEPIAIPDVIRALEPVAKADVPTGAGIAIYGHYAYVPARNAGFYILNITDPTHPTVVSNLTSNETFYVRYVEVMDLGDRIIVVGAGQSTGMHFLDVTDPAQPEVLATLQLPDRQPSHNVVVLRGTTLVYNTPSTGQGGVNHIVDVRNPDTPEVVGQFGDHGCHLNDVRMDLQRAYCAGVQESQIWDITDPLKPSLIGRVDHPLIGGPGMGLLRGLHHQALPNHDGTLLMISDEYSGGGSPGACFLNVPNPVTGSLSTPMGAVWFFDISNEEEPEFLSWFSPPLVPKLTSATPPQPVNCTAHIGTLVPGHDDLSIWAWYNSGIVLIDFSDPARPVMVTRWNDGTNTWDVEIYQGWIFTGDIARGLDVLKFV